MKKAISLFAAIFLILAAGCEKQEKTAPAPPPAPASFSSDLTVTYGSAKMTAHLIQNAAEDFSLKFLTPESLSRLTVDYKNGVCKVAYDGLSFETDLNRFPQTEIGTMLVNALSDAVQGMNLQTSYADGIWTYTGTGERGIFTLTRNGETGEWLEFTADGADLKITFSDFKQ